MTVCGGLVVTGRRSVGFYGDVTVAYALLLWMRCVYDLACTVRIEFEVGAH